MNPFWRGVFSLKHEWRIASYALFCIVAALVLSFASQDLGLVLFKHMALKGDSQLQSALSLEQTDLLNRLEAFSKRADVRDAVVEQNQQEVTSLFEAEQTRSGMSSIVVSDAEGVTFSKVPRFSDLGDNIFLTSTIGRVLSRGVSAVVYTPGRNFPLTLAAGVPIKKSSQLQGAVFGGYWFDDMYASRLKEKYFSHNQDIILYAKEDGVTGDSLQDLESKQLFRAYLNHASTYIKDGKSGDVISFKGNDYVVTNHLLFGEYDAIGGILVLKKLPLSIFWRSLIASLMVTLLFFAGALLIERITVRKILLPHKRLSLIFLGTLSFFVFCAAWFGLYFHALRIVDRLDKPAFSIYNSLLRIRPQSGVFAIGYPQRITVIVRSGGEALNTVDATLRYDPAVFDIEEIQTNRSICPEEFFIEKTIDQEQGLIHIICGIPGEGFTGVRGIVADIIVTPRTTGASAVTFDDSTQVLASDGLGSNVLRSVSGAYYRSFNKNDDATFSQESYVIPFSSTHENSTRWYSSRQVVIKWTSLKGAEYVYEFTDDASSTITSPKTISGDTVTLQAPGDGVFYFKIAPRKDGLQGKTSVLMIKIDTTPPETPVIRVSNTSVKADEVVRFEFGSQDQLSGVQPNFYVSINGSIYLPGPSRLFIPFKTPGTYKIDVRVFDNAENHSDGAVNITVKKD